MAKSMDAVHPELRWYIEDVAREVRRRRWMGAARRFGWVLFGMTALATLVLWLSAAGGGLAVGIAVAYLAGVVAGAIACAIPVFRRPVTLEQVALFIDERHPELESRIASALDLAQNDREGFSAWLTEKFLEESLERVRATSLADLLDPKPATTLGYNAAIMLVASLIFFFAFSGAWLPAISFFGSGSTAKVAALPFTVEPGDVRVRRGDNQMVWVRTTEPDREVTVRWRVPSGEWQEIPANPSSTEKVYYHEFANVQSDLEYQVRYGRQKSKPFKITAWLPPDVTGIDLTYHYPDYLGQPSREVPNSGNISAVEGTKVDVDVWTNKPVKKAEMVLESGARVPLVKKDKTRWQVPVTVNKDDAYRIELADEDGESNQYAPRYQIAMHRDRAPDVKIDFPRGDNEVTSIDEVPFDFAVTDDYGFSSYGVQYEIAGQEPVRIKLSEDGKLDTSAKGHHDLQLEKLGLEVGDFITWTIWAEDKKPGRSQYETLGDPFFLEVRPFKREYREALSNDGAGQGAGGGEESEPEKVQRNILIATWNLRRDSHLMDDSEFKEKRKTIAETQEKLLAGLDSQQPGAPAMQGAEAEMKRLREEMKGSLDAINRAELPDPKAPLSEATGHEQSSLRIMSHLKPRNAQVQQTQGGGGGGGGGGQRGDLKDLEMARNRNFYEQENLTRDQQKANDEALNKIKELAQRQQNVNEEIAKLVSELQTAKTDEERERLKRQLEKLRDEMKSNLEKLDQANQNLTANGMPNDQTRKTQDAMDRARHQMNRSLELMDRNELQQAHSAGARASDALEDMQQSLQQFGRDAAAQRMKDLQKRMKDLQEAQKQIAQGADKAQQLHQSPSMDDQKKLEDAQKQLGESKDKLAEDFKSMMDEASELASRGGQTQQLMTRRLGDWMRETSKEGIYEDIQESKPLVEYGIWQNAVNEEKKITDKLAKAGEKLDEVAGATVGNDLEGMQKALENLDKLLQREEVARGLGDKDPSKQQPGPGAPQDAQKDQQGAGGKQGEKQDKPGAGAEPNKDEKQPGAGQGDQPDKMASKQPGGGQKSDENKPDQQQGGSKQPGDKPSDEQQGDQRGGNPQDANSQQNSGGQQGGQRSAQERMAGRPQTGADRPVGARSGAEGGGPWDPDRAMRDFADRGYLDWVENLRDAESLLPDNSPLRNDVIKLRERIETMRRDYRVRTTPPRFDLFLQMAARPLADTAENLHKEIQRLLNEKEFLAQDEGDVPERYREPVAEYFKRLSESEGLK